MPRSQFVTTVFIDCETTGLDPTRHKLWEVGMIRVLPDGEEQEHSWMWWPDLSTADPMALTVNRFYDRASNALPGPWSDLAGGVLYVGDSHDSPIMEPLDQAAHDIAHFLDGTNMVGANPGFDASFLTVWLREQGHVFNPHYHLVDVEALAAGWIAAQCVGMANDGESRGTVPVLEGGAIINNIDGRPPWKHTDLVRALGINPADFDRHTALGDARMAKAVYKAVMG